MQELFVKLDLVKCSNATFERGEASRQTVPNAEYFLNLNLDLAKCRNS